MEDDLFFEYHHHVVPGTPSVLWGGHYTLLHKPSGLVMVGPDLHWDTHKSSARQDMRREMASMLRTKTT